MYSHVFRQADALSESALTKCAFERLRATVNSLVCVKLRPLTKSLLAFVTFIRSIAGVSADMCFQVAHKGALKVAMRTRIDLVLRMHAPMGPQVTGGKERIAAHVALEVSFV